MGLNIEDNKKLIEEVLEAYPKKRRKTARNIFRWLQIMP